MFLRKLGWLFALSLVVLPLGSRTSVRGQAPEAQPAAPAADVQTMVVAVDIDKNDPYDPLKQMVYAFPVAGELQTRIQVGPGTSAAVADFDMDGYCDVITLQQPKYGETTAPLTLYKPVINAKFRVEYQPTVLLANAFPSSTFAIRPRLGDSAVGDFDRDGRLDVAFSGQGCTTDTCTESSNELIQVMLNKAAGYQRVSIPLKGIDGRSYEHIGGIDTGNFNGDSFVDLAAQQYWEGPNNPFHILLNAPSVLLSDTTLITNTAATAIGGTSSLVSGDFNEDGITDIIAGQDDDGDPGQAWFFAGQGGGSFAGPVPAYDTNPLVESGGDKNGPGYADAYDFNGDGILDIFTASEQRVLEVAENIGLLLFLGVGDGTFATDPILYNTESFNWYKVAAPPENLEPCQQLVVHGMFLPIIRN